MIQRIQSLYLIIALIMVSLTTIGTELFSYVTESARYTFTSTGISEFTLDGKLVSSTHYPMYIGTIALALLIFLCLMSYKGLARQYKLGRLIFYLYFLGVVGLVLLATFGGSIIEAEESKREMGLGFILFIIGLPFIFLANVGIKRDKRLLESIDRIR